uniref:Leucine-rich repeat-containing N-terminal plant-type domain-containing protein n=1 Tax=Oryza glumipatula TaxID=40148 RepID=A0A0E0AUL2_9ORYZ
MAASRRRPSGGASSPDPCGGTWVGVTFNGEGRVTAINASRGGLTGHLVGADLSMLASLSELDLSFNALRDDLPVLPQPLGGLRALDLRSNSPTASSPPSRRSRPSTSTTTRCRP